MRVNKCDLSWFFFFFFFGKLWSMINIYNFSFALFYFILFFSRDNFRYFLIIILGNVFFYEIYVIRCVVPDLRKYEIRNGSIFQR